MSYRKMGWVVVTCLVLASVVTSCAPTTVKETVIVEKPVEKIVKETVIVEKPVDKIVKETVVVEQTVEVLVPAPEEVTLTFWSWFCSDRANMSRAPLHRLQAFEAAYPNIKVEVNELDPFKIWETYQVIMPSPNAPDVFASWQGERTFAFAEQGLLMDLTPVLDADPDWRDSFYESMWPHVTWDGKKFGVPVSLTTHWLFYNKELFKQAGVAEPEWGWTWDDFIATCEALKAGGVAPLVQGEKGSGGANSMFNFVLKLVPPEVLAADMNIETAQFTDPGYVEAFRRYKYLVDQGYFVADPNAVGYVEGLQMFGASQAAMIIDGDWVIGSFTSANIAPEPFWDDFDVVSIPSIPEGKGDPDAIQGGSGGVYEISASTRHPEEAIAFLKWMSSVESAAYYCKLTKMGVAQKGCLPDDPDPRQVKVVEGVSKASNLSAGWLNLPAAIGQGGAYTHVGEGVIAGMLTPEEAMEQIRAAVKEEQAKAAGS